MSKNNKNLISRFFQDTLPEFIEIARLQKQMCSLIPSVSQGQYILKKIRNISRHVPCPHQESHMFSYLIDLLSIPDDMEGCIVEAGAFKGGSTAKCSIIAKEIDRPLIVFDSFEGLPNNEESHDKSILGHSIEDWFKEGEFCGTLEEVKKNISAYGEIDMCQFKKGWFDDTMPGFSQKICAVYLDVDLASSTRTCLKYLYPLIVPGGILYSQDGDFPLVIEVFDDDAFWETEVRCKKPAIQGLRESKMIKIVKPR